MSSAFIHPQLRHEKRRTSIYFQYCMSMRIIYWFRAITAVTVSLFLPKNCRRKTIEKWQFVGVVVHCQQPASWSIIIIIISLTKHAKWVQISARCSDLDICPAPFYCHNNMDLEPESNAAAGKQMIPASSCRILHGGATQRHTLRRPSEITEFLQKEAWSLELPSHNLLSFFQG